MGVFRTRRRAEWPTPNRRKWIPFKLALTLDKGIVVDAWGLVFLAGVDLGIRVEARMVVASIDTYLKHAGPIGLLDSVPKRFARRNLAYAITGFGG